MMSALLFAAATAVCTPQAGVTPEQAVDRYIASYNAHDLNAVRATYTADVRIHVWYQDQAQGILFPLDEVMGGLSRFVEANPTVQVTPSQRAVLNARVAQVETYSTNQEALVIYTVIDGCVVARDTYW